MTDLPLSSLDELNAWLKRHAITEPAKSQITLLKSNLKHWLAIPPGDEWDTTREAYRKTVVGQFNIVAGAAIPRTTTSTGE